MRKRILSLLLAALMVLTVVPFAGLGGLFAQRAEATLVKNKPATDYIRFGSYPTDRVTDTTLIGKLNSAIGTFDTNANKKSYNFVFGTGSPGSAKTEHYAHYIDFTYDGQKYRAVKFAAYRPTVAYQSYIPMNSAVDDNGYGINTVYFFKYDDLYWDVLDAEQGLLVCDDVIDGAWFNGTYNVVNGKWLVAAAEYPNMYANCYYMSDLSSKLSSKYHDGSFYNIAFDDDQKARLADVPIANVDQNGNEDYINYPDPGFTEKVSSLSVQQYSAYRVKNPSEVCEPTDYAKCMGVGFDKNTGAGSFWLTNRYTYSVPTYFSKFAAFIGFNGNYISDSQVDSLHGVRPVIRLTGDYDLTEITLQFDGSTSTGSTPNNFVKNPGKFSAQHYYVNRISWRTGTAGSFSATVPTLQSGKTYYVQAQIFPDVGWMFDTNLTVKTSGVSGLKCTRKEVTNAFATLEYQFTVPEDQPVYGMSAGWAVPKLGKALEHKATTETTGQVSCFNVTEKWTKNGSVVSPGTTLTAGTYTVEVNYALKPGYYMVDNFILQERVSSFWKPDGEIELTFDVSKGTAKAKTSYTLSDTINFLNLMIPQEPLPGSKILSYQTPGARDAAGNYVAGTSAGSAVKIDGYWYEGQNIPNPTQMHADDMFVKGKTYTYRFIILPNSGFSWGSNPSFALNGTDKAPTEKLMNVGRYIVDFTYESLTERVSSVVINNVTYPCNGVGFITDPAVASTGGNADRYYVNLSKGWYDKPEGSVVSPQVGEIYYLMVVLSAESGYSFNPYNTSMTFTLRDKNNYTVPVEKSEYKVWSRQRDNDTVTCYFGIKCTEKHALKNVLADIDSPQVGKKLDTEVSLNAPLTTLAFISYYINGEKVIDPDAKPAAGDVVDVYVGLTTHSGAVFDEGVYLNWLFDGDTLNSRRSYRIEQAGVPENVAVFTQRFNMPYNKTPEVVDSFTFTNVTQPVKGTAASSSAVSGEPDKYVMHIDNGLWMNVDGLETTDALESSESFQSGTMYALRVTYKMKDGYLRGDGAKYKLVDKNGTEVDYDHAETAKLGDYYVTKFFMDSIDKAPAKTVDRIIINGVTQPIIGERVGDGQLTVSGVNRAFDWATAEEPWKYQLTHTTGFYWFEMYDYDHENYIDAGASYDKDTDYCIIIHVAPQPGYVLSDRLGITLYDDDGKEVDYNAFETTKDFEVDGGYTYKLFLFRPIESVPEKQQYYTMVFSGSRTPVGPQDPGTKITVTADKAPEGKEFYRWVVVEGNAKLANVTAATTTFVQPAENVTLRATYKDKGSTPGGVDYTLGDVDGKDGVTAADARLALRAAVGLESYAPGSREFLAADVDVSGTLTAADARLILRHAVKLTDAEWGGKP